MTSLRPGLAWATLPLAFTVVGGDRSRAAGRLCSLVGASRVSGASAGTVRLTGLWPRLSPLLRQARDLFRVPVNKGTAYGATRSRASHGPSAPLAAFSWPARLPGAGKQTRLCLRVLQSRDESWMGGPWGHMLLSFREKIPSWVKCK